MEICAAMGMKQEVVECGHKNEPTARVPSDHRLEALGRNGFHRRSILTAGIVHEPVDTAVGADHRVDCGDHHPLVADIANLTDDHPAILFDLRSHLRELFGSTPEDPNVGAT